jgi:hypothetical protein
VIGNGVAAARGGRGGGRAVGLLVVVFATSIVQPTVLVALPLLVMMALGAPRGAMATFVAILATLVAIAGPRDGLWYVERAWALSVGGAFAALSLVRPAWRVTSRAIASIVGASAVFTGFLVPRSSGWAALDWTVSDRLRGGFATWVDAMAVLRDGQAPSPALVGAIWRTVEAQVHVFPALLALETVAALGLAWWLCERLARGGGDGGLGPVAQFRFNDQLVWVMILGLVLLSVRLGDGAARVGANLAVFMAGLYALRGFAVGLGVSGGISLFGYAMIALGLVFMAPAVIAFAVLLGVADTWLDLRTRAASLSA